MFVVEMSILPVTTVKAYMGFDWVIFTSKQSNAVLSSIPLFASDDRHCLDNVECTSREMLHGL